MPGAYFTLEMDVMIERMKVNTTVNGTAYSGSPQCSDPVSQLATTAGVDCFYLQGVCLVDPLQNNDGTVCANSPLSLPCGQILNVVRFKDLDCWAEEVQDTFMTFPRTSANVHFSDPTSNFTAVMSLQLLQGDVDYYPPVSSNSTFPVYRYRCVSFSAPPRNSFFFILAVFNISIPALTPCHSISQD